MLISGCYVKCQVSFDCYAALERMAIQERRSIAEMGGLLINEALRAAPVVRAKPGPKPRRYSKGTTSSRRA